MSSINRRCTDGLATLITVNIIGKTLDELRVLVLLRWIGRDVFGGMRFAVYVPQLIAAAFRPEQFVGRARRDDGEDEQYYLLNPPLASTSLRNVPPLPGLMPDPRRLAREAGTTGSQYAPCVPGPATQPARHITATRLESTSDERQRRARYA
jgi:hypothetical protein